MTSSVSTYTFGKEETKSLNYKKQIEAGIFIYNDITYTIKKKLGTGVYGNVFLIENKEGKQLALKTTRTGSLHENFSLWKKLSFHKNVVHLYDYFKSGGMFYIVMEYIEGKSLQDLIDTKTQVDLETFIDWSYDICRAVRSLHNQGIVYRDFKPDNIIIQEVNWVTSADSKSISRRDRFTVRFIDVGLMSDEESNLFMCNKTLGYLHLDYGVNERRTPPEFKRNTEMLEYLEDEDRKIDLFTKKAGLRRYKGYDVYSVGEELQYIANIIVKEKLPEWFSKILQLMSEPSRMKRIKINHVVELFKENIKNPEIKVSA